MNEQLSERLTQLVAAQNTERANIDVLQKRRDEAISEITRLSQNANIRAGRIAELQQTLETLKDETDG